MNDTTDVADEDFDPGEAADPNSEDAPTEPELDPQDKHTVLQARVRGALLALPGEFEFGNPVSGIAATDLFNLNTLLGAGIEVEVVGTLLAIHAEGGYDDSETLASIRSQYQELIGQLPDTTQGSK